MDYAHYTRHQMQRRLAAIHRQRRREAWRNFIIAVGTIAVMAAIAAVPIVYLAWLWFQGRI